MELTGIIGECAAMGIQNRDLNIGQDLAGNGVSDGAGDFKITSEDMFWSKDKNSDQKQSNDQ